ncbi:putative tRNA nucleotidyl transferase protein [Desulfamplus magnetovallimortis]|uniref:Putative tRNA nucleotidyl transferase protein n=1 Tax=Desulfamplus magnetovallimortis TaxID=1246637 RepID=A0A1W1H866_9BACT|nr:CBS domain-containing protein [Desulfamplus magnetovallimortis]SLM28575.1 putative tRNA nucleotidyl transferase protein [Desulfamplus magnetovallimortis]
MQIITTHKGTDFDALASLVAGTIIYPGSKPVLPGSVNPNLKSFLSIHKDLFGFYSPGEIKLEEVKSMVVVDTNSWRRLDGMAPLKTRSNVEIINWDHHPEGDIKADEVYREELGANITLMLMEIQKLRKLITPIQATLFIMGLYEDTGNLTFTSTTSKDALAAAYLLDRKADLQILSTFLRHSYGKKQKDILFEMIQNAERMEVSGFSISIARMDIEGHVQNLSVVVQMYREIVNVDAAFAIFRDTERDRCMVIGRSNLEQINIGLIMRSMGGGGHPGAGSALLKATNPDVIEEMLIEMIRGNQQTSIMLSDIMSYPVVTVTEDTTIDEVAMILRETGCTGVPVVNENENVVGVISRRDFRKIKKNSHMQSPVKAFMSRDVITIDHTRSAIDAARLMIKHDIGRIPVIEDGRVIGIVTRSDVMLYFYDLLPD